MEGSDGQRQRDVRQSDLLGSQHRPSDHSRRSRRILPLKITVDVRGEILELKDTINTMVDQLNGFAS